MKTYRDIIIIAILFLGILFASTYKLIESPSVWYDEGIYVQIATNLANNGLVGMRFSPTEILHVSKFTVEYPVIYPLAGVFKIFGFSILSARLLMVFLFWVLLSPDIFLLGNYLGQIWPCFLLLCWPLFLRYMVMARVCWAKLPDYFLLFWLCC